MKISRAARPSEERRLGTDRPAKTKGNHEQESTKGTTTSGVRSLTWCFRRSGASEGEVDLGGGGVWSRNDQQKSSLVQSLLNTLNYPAAAGVRALPVWNGLTTEANRLGVPKIFKFFSHFWQSRNIILRIAQPSSVGRI